MEPEVIEASARLDPLEDRSTKIRTKTFAFFHDYIHELKDCQEAPNELEYPIKMIFRMPASEHSVFMDNRRIILNAWSSEFWNKFYRFRGEFEDLRDKYNEKAGLLASYCDRVAEAAGSDDVTIDSHLLDLKMVNVFGKSKEAMQKLDDRIIPVIKRFEALESVALKAKEIIWKIHDLPDKLKTKKLKDGFSVLTWEIVIRVNEDWANELERLNVKLINDTMSGTDLADLENPRSRKCKSLKILNKVFGCPKESTEGIKIADPDNEAYALNIVTEALADMALAKLLAKNRDIEDKYPQASSSPPSHTSLVRNSPNAPVRKRAFSFIESDYNVEDARSFSPQPVISSAPSPTSNPEIGVFDEMDID